MSKSVDALCREQSVQFDELVQRSGLDRSRIEAIYLGRWTPSPQERKKIAAVFDVAVADITWGHKTPIQHIYGSGPD
ncbi:MAG: helix-turn-helix transcriptional regulator [Planctomycetales bacterium]